MCYKNTLHVKYDLKNFDFIIQRLEIGPDVKEKGTQCLVIVCQHYDNYKSHFTDQSKV